MIRSSILIFFIVLLAGCSESQNSDVTWLEDGKGNRIPQDLHIGWPVDAYAVVNGERVRLDESARILSMLKKEGMEVQIVDYADHRFMYWSKEDDECIRKIIERNMWCTLESNKNKNENASKTGTDAA